MQDNNKKIKSYKDLEVFQEAYDLMLEVFYTIIPQLPTEERFDLIDQIRRSSKAVPRLIAEGYSKRHQPRGFKRYLDDALTECNETVVSLMQTRDLYSLSRDGLIGRYEVLGKRIYSLRKAWINHHNK